MGVEEKRKPRRELVHLPGRGEGALHVLDAVAQREGQFLNRGRAGFADVIAADRDRIEARRVLGAELDRVGDQAHRRLGRIDVFLLRDVFLEDVVLQRAGDLAPVRALLFGDREIHGPDRRGRRIDGHRNGDVGERNLVEESFHVRERTDGDAAFADFAFGQRMVGVVAHQRGKIEGDGEAGLALREQVAIAALVSSAEPKPANWRMVQRRSRYIAG